MIRRSIQIISDKRITSTVPDQYWRWRHLANAKRRVEPYFPVVKSFSSNRRFYLIATRRASTDADLPLSFSSPRRRSRSGSRTVETSGSASWLSKLNRPHRLRRLRRRRSRGLVRTFSHCWRYRRLCILEICTLAPLPILLWTVVEHSP